MSDTFHWGDWLVIAFYFVITICIGLVVSNLECPPAEKPDVLICDQCVGLVTRVKHNCVFHHVSVNGTSERMLLIKTVLTSHGHIIKEIDLFCQPSSLAHSGVTTQGFKLS